MAMEKAIIVSDVEALQAMVLEGQTGLIHRADDADSLAGCISLLVEEKEFRAYLGKAGRAWAVANRDWATLTQRYLDVYARFGVTKSNAREGRPPRHSLD
jgi:glycosyltransferase involved in cell wall biosynthesis